MQKIRLGIIGLGNVYEFQKKALKMEHNLNVIALCDYDETKARHEASCFNAIYYTDYKLLLQNPEIDAVLVSTPVATHYEIGIEVLHSKKHLLIEKPATIDIEEFLSLQNTAKKNNVKIIVAFHAAFAKDLLWFIEEYKEKLYDIIGPITGIDCQFFDPYITDGILGDKATSLVGSWIDSGINALSVVAQLIDLNSLKLKEKLLIERKAYATSNISGTVVFETNKVHAEACIVTIKTDWTLNKNLKVSILYFDNSSNKIILNHTEQKVIMINKMNQSVILKDFSSEEMRLVAHYKGVFNDFVKRILSSEDNFDFAFKTHKLLLDGIN